MTAGLTAGLKSRLPIFATIALVLGLVVSAGAYSRIGPRWAPGSIVMHLQMGAGSGTLSDGSTSWNAVTEGALGTWNPFLNGVAFTVVRDSTAAIAEGNRINNVFFADDVFGDSFDDAIAIALYFFRRSDNTFTEGDVIFNRRESWNSYRGNLRNALDLRRVALHEFGHVLGLDHPDESGQNVNAIMNSYITNADSLQTDDTNGAQAIYGAVSAGNRAPTVTVSCSPCTVESGQTSDLRATATDADGDALTYSWSAPDGSFSSTTSTTPVWRAPVQPASVVATVTVRDARGASTTGTVTLQVVFRDRLVPSASLTSGLSLVSGNGRYRLAYQSDGNLVLYDGNTGAAVWNSGTAGSNAGQAAMQADGNFVIYDSQNSVRFSTGTAGNANATLYVQSDGNIVIYSSGLAVWDRFSNP